MKTVLALILAMAATAPGSVAGLNSRFYYPDHRIYSTPADDGYAFEEIAFQSLDGTRLSGWFIPAQGKAIGTVIHFHGNARNMGFHYPYVSWLPAKGFNLFLFDYRGYGKSEGTPTRKGVYEDSVAAVEYIKSRTDIDQGKIILFGQSLGGANALCVAGKNRFDGVVGIAVDSAFSSYKSVAMEHVHWLKPAAFFLIGNKLSPKRHVGDIAPTPLLIIHGTADQTVPYEHAKKLFARANEPKALWTIEGGRHIDALGSHRDEIMPRLCAQFTEWVASPAPPHSPRAMANATGRFAKPSTPMLRKRSSR